MKQYARELVLEGITEADFQNWKHHPVTKLVRRYHRDMERFWSEQQIAAMRNAAHPLSDFLQGEFKGVINTRKSAAEIEYQEVFEFYPPDKESEEEES